MNTFRSDRLTQSSHFLPLLIFLHGWTQLRLESFSLMFFIFNSLLLVANKLNSTYSSLPLKTDMNHLKLTNLSVDITGGKLSCPFVLTCSGTNGPKHGTATITNCIITNNPPWG